MRTGNYNLYYRHEKFITSLNYILGSCQKNDDEMRLWSCVENECLYAYNQIHQEIHTQCILHLKKCLSNCPY